MIKLVFFLDSGAGRSKSLAGSGSITHAGFAQTVKVILIEAFHVVRDSNSTFLLEPHSNELSLSPENERIVVYYAHL